MSISLSSEVSPRRREYERTSTVVANAYVKPIVGRFLAGLEAAFASLGFTGELRIMQSNGGLTTPALAREYPVNIIESGPAAGVLASRATGARESVEHVITFDMGGTTAKVGVIDGGEPVVTSTFEVDGVNLRKWSGLPLDVPAVELVEIGAGGGSIASARLGVVSVGPESAGAEPGPACYGRGGGRATLTDANLVLGYLDPESFAGGQLRIDRPAAERATRTQVGEPLGLDLAAAAWGRAPHRQREHGAGRFAPCPSSGGGTHATTRWWRSGERGRSTPARLPGRSGSRGSSSRGVRGSHPPSGCSRRSGTSRFP